MFVNLPATTFFYRITGRDIPWAKVLTGEGAFFGIPQGNRYNASRQATVYAAADPVVTLTEGAFRQGLFWHEQIGSTILSNQHVLPPPFSTTVRLWCFRLTPPPVLIDLTDPAAVLAFRHPPYGLLNPSHAHYEPTQNLMDAVYHFPPGPGGRRAQGIQAPSVRTPRVGGYRPLQQVFFLLAGQPRLAGVAVCSWDLTVEFLEADTRSPVTPHTLDIDWRCPRFWLEPRGASAAGGLPAFGRRSAYPVGIWHDLVLDICYA